MIEQIYEVEIFDDGGESTDERVEVTLKQFFESINVIINDNYMDFLITPEMYEEIKSCKVGEYVEFSKTKYPNDIKRIK